MTRIRMLTFFFGLLFDAGATDDRNGPKCTFPVFSPGRIIEIMERVRLAGFLSD